MKASDRQREIVLILSHERHTTIPYLMQRLHASRSTIKRDLDDIYASGDAHFYTENGQYGGIFAEEGWYASEKFLTPDQEKAIRNYLEGRPTEDDKDALASILISFGVPKNTA
mgnify:CR=1 FL=1